MPLTQYNPYSATQNAFLGALSLSEVGSKGSVNLGTLGAGDLSDRDRDEYGFPIWEGRSNSHAAGYFQFQPGTWETYAKTYDLDFQDAEDQKKAAWLHAQRTYTQETGGDLTAALEAGDYSSIEAALGRTQWIGARGKLAAFLSGGKSAKLPGSGNAPSDDAFARNEREGGVLGRWLMDKFGVDVNAGMDAEPGDGIIPRIGVFIIGGLLLLVATWWLLSSAGVVPSAGSVAKSAAKVAAVAA